MRCLSCNVVLNDKEATRKYVSGEFLDLCNNCYKSVEEELPTIEGNDEDFSDGSHKGKHEQEED